MDIFGKFSKAKNAAAEQKKAAESKPAAPSQPYKHVPTHAMADSLACAPPGANSEEDRQQIKMEMRRRSEMPVMPRPMSGLSAFSVVTTLNRNSIVPSGWTTKTTDQRSRAASPTAPPVPNLPANVPANRTPKASLRTSGLTENSRNKSEQSLLRNSQQSPMPPMPSINMQDTRPALSPLHTGSRNDLGVTTSGSSQMLRPSMPGQWQTESEQRLSYIPGEVDAIPEDQAPVEDARQAVTSPIQASVSPTKDKRYATRSPLSWNERPRQDSQMFIRDEDHDGSIDSAPRDKTPRLARQSLPLRSIYPSERKLLQNTQHASKLQQPVGNGRFQKQQPSPERKYSREPVSQLQHESEQQDIFAPTQQRHQQPAPRQEYESEAILAGSTSPRYLRQPMRVQAMYEAEGDSYSQNEDHHNAGYFISGEERSQYRDNDDREAYQSSGKQKYDLGSQQPYSPDRSHEGRQQMLSRRVSDMPQIFSRSSTSSKSSSSKASEILVIPDLSERRPRPMQPEDRRISGNSHYANMYRNVDRAGPNAERQPVERQQQQQLREYSQTPIDEGRNTPRGGMLTPAQQHPSTYCDRRPTNDGRTMPRAQRQAPPQQQPMQYDNPPRQSLRPQAAPALIGLGPMPGQDRLPQSSSRNGYRGNEGFQVNNSGYRGTSRVPAEGPKLAPMQSEKDWGRQLPMMSMGILRAVASDRDYNRQFISGSAYPYIAAHEEGMRNDEMRIERIEEITDR